jgi:hypothetical protein
MNRQLSFQTRRHGDFQSSALPTELPSPGPAARAANMECRGSCASNIFSRDRIRPIQSRRTEMHSQSSIVENAPEESTTAASGPRIPK